jgi:hypothetical protein
MGLVPGAGASQLGFAYYFDLRRAGVTTMNCAAWAMAQVAGISGDEMLDLLRPYAERGWVEYNPAGVVIRVMMPEVAVELLPTLGHRVASFKGTGPAQASGWARWSHRWFPGSSLLLIVDGNDGPGGHVVISQDSLIRDNNNPDGLSGEDHPTPRRGWVSCVLRFDGAGDARRWPIVGELSDPPAR